MGYLEQILYGVIEGSFGQDYNKYIEKLDMVLR
jgi:hypothetical protein